MENKTPYEIEYLVVLKDGQVKYLLEHCETYYSRNGTPRRSLGTVQDITERKHMQDLLVQTEKMMSVGGLAAGMAHELNNPLGGILHGIQNIQRRLSPE